MYNVSPVDGLVWNEEAAGSNPATQTSLMRGSFNGKITGFHPVVKGSIPLPRTSFRMRSANSKIQLLIEK